MGTSTARPLTICCIFSLFGSFTQMTLKCMFGMFGLLPGAFADVRLYAIVAVFFACDISMEMWRQRALRDFDALFVVPIGSAMILCLTVALGGACFDEIRGNGLSLGLSVLLCIVGVLGMSIPQKWVSFRKSTAVMPVS